MFNVARQRRPLSPHYANKTAKEWEIVSVQYLKYIIFSLAMKMARFEQQFCWVGETYLYMEARAHGGSRDAASAYNLTTRTGQSCN